MNGQLITRFTSILAGTGYAARLLAITIPVLIISACTGTIDSYGGLLNLQLTAPSQNTDGSPLTDLSGYIIYYGISPDALKQKIVVDNRDLTGDEVLALLSQENILPGTTYYISVKAVNSRNIRSRSSNIVSISTP